MEDSPSFYNKMFNWYELEKNTVNVGTLGWVGTALSDSLQRESKMFKLLSVCIENTDVEKKGNTGLKAKTASLRCLFASVL